MSHKMSGLEVAIPGNFSSPGMSPSLQRNQGKSQSLVSEMLPLNSNTAIMYPSRYMIAVLVFRGKMGEAVLVTLLKDHGQCPMLRGKR